MADNSNGKSFGGFFAVLFILAAFMAMVGNFIKPLEHEIQSLREQLSRVEQRAIEADHLPQITVLSEKFNGVAGEILAIREVENLHFARTNARLKKLENWREDDNRTLTELRVLIARLEERINDCAEHQCENGGP